MSIPFKAQGTKYHVCLILESVAGSWGSKLQVFLHVCTVSAKMIRLRCIAFIPRYALRLEYLCLDLL